MRANDSGAFSFLHHSAIEGGKVQAAVMKSERGRFKPPSIVLIVWKAIARRHFVAVVVAALTHTHTHLVMSTILLRRRDREGIQVVDFFSPAQI